MTVNVTPREGVEARVSRVRKHVNGVCESEKGEDGQTPVDRVYARKQTSGSARPREAVKIRQARTGKACSARQGKSDRGAGAVKGETAESRSGVLRMSVSGAGAL